LLQQQQQQQASECIPHIQKISLFFIIVFREKKIYIYIYFLISKARELQKLAKLARPDQKIFVCRRELQYFSLASNPGPLVSGNFL
jgi:hypothetical protein